MQNTAKKLIFSGFFVQSRQWVFLGGVLALILRSLVAAQPAAAESLLTDGVTEILTAKQAIAVLNHDDSKPVFGPEAPPSVSDLLLDVCQKRGYGENCAKTLMGMAFKESRFDGDAIGDQGKARGYFQIHYKMHKVALSCAEDLRCSANWTISYLESNGYPKRVQSAIQCHNGCGVNNGYAASATRHGERLWAIAKAAPLAMK